MTQNTTVTTPLPTGSEVTSRAGVADLLTVMAIAIVAYVFASVIHEDVGHGGTCLLTGGHPLALSTLYFECGDENKLVAAGGTIANCVFGILFLVMSRVVPQRLISFRYFLWLSMTINLLQAGGYFLFSGIGNIGDWAAVIQGWHPAWAWRIGLIVLGIASYLMFIRLALLELRPFLGTAGPDRFRRAKRLCIVPYFTGGILSCVAGLFNPVGMILVAISAAAASFGGTSGLAWMWQMMRGNRFQLSDQQLEAPSIKRSNSWLAIGALLAVVFVAVLGPGLKF
jgi:hypothetical protein